MSPAEAARDLLKNFGLWKPPIPVELIARQFADLEYAQLETLSGILIRDHGNFVIVNAQDITSRQRFSISHELGHIFCGHEGRSFLCQSDFSTSSITEREANIFAAELLMPAKVFEAICKMGRSEWELAKRFNVSREAVRWRLVDLGFRTREEVLGMAKNF